MPLRLVDDTAYNATTWDGVTGIAPSKNAVRDQVEAIAGLVTVADEAVDNSCFPLFATAATGTLIGVKSNAGLTFNAATGALTIDSDSAQFNIRHKTTPRYRTTLQRSATALQVTNYDDTGTVYQPITVYGSTISLFTGTAGAFTALHANASGYVGFQIPSPTALIHVAASSTDRASLCLNQGIAPTTPINGDIWNTSSGQFHHIAGVTQTVAYASNKLSAFAATTSAQLAGVISDEVSGTGAKLLFGNQTVSTDSTPQLERLGIGYQAATNSGIHIFQNALATSTQVGITNTVIGTSDATLQISCMDTYPRTAASAFTVGDLFGVRCRPYTLGATSSATRYAGIYVDDATGATTNIGVSLNMVAATNTWNVYAAGTAANHFAGNVLIGNTNGTAMLSVGSSSQFNVTSAGAATAVSLACPTFTSAAAMTFTPTAGNNFNVVCSGAGDFVVNTNLIYGDSSASNVGIGTTAPTQMFAVGSSSQFNVTSAGAATAVSLACPTFTSAAAMTFTPTSGHTTFMGASGEPSGTGGSGYFSMEKAGGYAILSFGGQTNSPYCGWIQCSQSSTVQTLALNPSGGNVGIGTMLSNNALSIGGGATRSTTQPTNGIDIFNGTAPVGTLTNGATLYVTSGEMRAMDAAGNATLISPHDAAGNWIHEEINFEGRYLRVHMERLIKALDKMLGGGYIEETVGGSSVEKLERLRKFHERTELAIQPIIEEDTQ